MSGRRLRAAETLTGNGTTRAGPPGLPNRHQCRRCLL